MTENDMDMKKDRAVLVGLSAYGLPEEENADESSMEELSALLETAGGQCVGTVFQNRASPDPRTFLGEGKVAEVKQLVSAMEADMVIVDNPLPPSQQRVLSEELGVTVLDRAASSWTSSPSGPAPGRAGSRWSWPSTSICCPG